MFDSVLPSVKAASFELVINSFLMENPASEIRPQPAVLELFKNETC